MRFTYWFKLKVTVDNHEIGRCGARVDSISSGVSDCGHKNGRNVGSGNSVDSVGSGLVSGSGSGNMEPKAVFCDEFGYEDELVDPI